MRAQWPAAERRKSYGSQITDLISEPLLVPLFTIYGGKHSIHMIPSLVQGLKGSLLEAKGNN